MKILQIIPNLLTGGAQRFTVDLSNALSDEHNLSLLTLFDSTEKDIFRRRLNGSVISYSINKRSGFDYRVFRRLHNIINEVNPDIIHSHLRSLNYLVLIYPFLKELPLVYTVHSDAFEDCLNPIIRAFRKKLFRQHSVSPVTISEESQKSFKKAYQHTESKLIINGRAYPRKSPIYSSVVKKVQELKPNNKTNVFVHIGRISPEKNQLMLVEAFKYLIEKDNENAILLIIGGGRDTDESRRIKQQLHLAEQDNSYIHLLGELDNATDYLHAADFFCLSSKYEGMPITLIEAFATGCIPLCTSVGGVTEMITELYRELLVKNISANNYYRILKETLEFSEEKLCALKSHAVELFHKNYSIERCANNYYQLYNELLRN